MEQARRLNILLVEGDDGHARVVATLLNAAGHAVTRAGSLAEAAQLCEIGRFDVLIAADALPDGAACELMEGRACGGVPGIVIADPATRLCRGAEQFGGRVDRPVRADALRGAIARVTRR